MESIAIIGLGCRVPGASSPEAFWQLVRDRIDAIREVPESRWSRRDLYDPTPQSPGKMNTVWAGMLEEVGHFDHEFFGISPREAAHMDPQQRLLLEVVWESLEHAGQSPDRLRGSDTGVFVGISSDDYSRLFTDFASIEAYSGTGNALSVAANRISYLLDWRGPSWIVDTACSSSLVAIHQAAQSLRLRECSLAIAAGVNLVLTPQLTIAFSQAGMMSPGGRCRAFDDSADGYVRGEGCGAVVLKRFADALRDRDNILAVIRGSAVNQDGRTNGLTSPNGRSQQAVIRKALDSAGVSPEHISYVEAHGTGTSLGDPIEMNSLMDVLMPGRSPDARCWVGSVKTNIGHLEAAAGIAGLIKVVLALSHKTIPPQLHLTSLNRYIALEGTPFRIPVECEPWPGEQGRRLAGVSSFGFAGTNAHVILQEAPARKSVPAQADRPCHLLTLSARNPPSLRALAARYAGALAGGMSLPDVCFTANTGRAHFQHRLAIVSDRAPTLHAALQRFADAGEAIDGASCCGFAAASRRPRVAFLFTGERAQLAGIGRELYETEGTFRRVVDRCDAVVRQVRGTGLLQVLYGDAVGTIDETGEAQPAQFAVAVALAELWRSWGIEPSVALGHGLGEYAAACVAGVFGMDDGVRLVCARGALMQAQATLEAFRAVAREVGYAAPALDLISNVTGRAAGAEVAQAEYWVEHVQRPAQCAAGKETLAAAGVDACVEIGPGMSDWQQLLETLSHLYVAGCDVNWTGFDRAYPRQRVVLPTYPFQRERAWLTTRNAAPATPGTGASHPLLGRRLELAGRANEFVFESQISAERPPFLKHHRVNGQPVFPGSGYIEMAVAAGRIALDRPGALAVENVAFSRPLVLLAGAGQTVQFHLTRDEGRPLSFEVHALTAAVEGQPAHWVSHASGKVRALGEEPAAGAAWHLPSLRSEIAHEVAATDVFSFFGKLGNEYGPSFRAIEQVWRHGQRSLGRIRLPEPCVSESQHYAFHPVLLDACLQLVGVASSDLEAEGTEPWVPVALDRVEIYARPGGEVWGLAETTAVDAQSASADVTIVTSEGTRVAQVSGLRLRRMTGTLASDADPVAEWFYGVEWHAATPIAAEVSPAGEMLKPSEIAHRLQASLPSIVSEHELEPYLDAVGALERSSVHYVSSALRELGWQMQRRERFSTEVKAAELGIAPQHRRLFNRLLEILAEEHVLRRFGLEWEVIDPEGLRGEPQLPATARALLETELTLLERCGPRLADVLRGQCDPVELLFPRGDLTAAGRLYEVSPGAKSMNGLVQQAVSAALQHLGSSRDVRVLEIGAGTGGTTSAIVSRLPLEGIEYVFTDVSPWFTARARERFGHLPFMTYAVLDVERDPAAQGFQAAQFDVVVAANVLHATRDLRRTLENVRSLLTPGGLLVLLEGTNRVRWVDLIFGLTDGWWRFADTDLRPEYPLLTIAGWTALLAEMGFADSASVSPFLDGDDAQSAVIVAQAGEGAQRAAGGVRWLICADGQGVGRGLARDLRSRGDSCTLVFAGDELSLIGEDEYELNPRSEDGFQRLFSFLAAQGAADVDGLVFLWSLDGDADASQIDRSHRVTCGSVLQLIQAVASAKLQYPPALWLVTRGAVPASGSISAPALSQAPLWGMANVIALEHPELRCVRVDLDPEGGADPSEILLHEITSRGAEDRIAVRSGVRHAARLVRHQVSRDEYQLPIRADASYLITGGLSGLGLLLAQWMVDRGARQIVLVGRGGPGERAARVMSELRDRGAGVTAFEADVTDADAMARAIASVQASMPPLRGVVHAAGILDDGILLNLTWERFQRVLAPKTLGAWNLHTLTASSPLDFFVMFSSTASVFGSPGQANHAAANAYLDALAHHRRGRGLPAVSINWGAWSEVGSAVDKGIDAWLGSRGVGTISPPLGLEAFRRVICSPAAQVVVVPVDWPAFCNSDGGSPFITELRAAPAAPQAAVTSFLQRFERVPPKDKHAFLLDHVRSQVAIVRGVAPSVIDLSLGLFELGLDSLMAIDLRKTLEESLGCSLPSTIAFDYPTVEALVDYMARDILFLEHVPDRRARVLDEKTQLSAALQPLSADEVASRLTAKLAALRGTHAT